MNYNLNFHFLLNYRAVLWEGLLNTVQLSLAIMVSGFLLGTLLALLRLSPRPAVRAVGQIYVNLLRNLPALIVLFWFFYALPLYTGMQVSRFLTAWLAFSLYTAAYFCEILRGSLQKLPAGQWEAASMLGFSRRRAFAVLMLPQALRHSLPALVNEVIEIVKISAVAATIAFPELLSQARMISDSEYRPVETYTAVAGIIMVFILLLSALAWLIEARYVPAKSRSL
ncbi:amino acid ABC transporter permease [Erwinia sp. JUb26]|uniref:amino acid ABC transporter permease n=1 Tax=Erwinia sp. JUb26 TaxID=2485126 RepID=UPI000F4A5434|nr:amino acid ABC transporter permease [Erwinia sp. JUb26]ROR11591.1 polar amino acid transport system permease protein [Erwinia sp. JUb26]